MANDLGNLVQRLATMANKNGIVADKKSKMEFSEGYKVLMDKFEFARAFDHVWGKVQGLNKRIDDEKPWELAKNGEKEKLDQCLNGLISDLRQVAIELSPFIPDTSDKILHIFDEEIKPPKTPLFPKS